MTSKIAVYTAVTAGYDQLSVLPVIRDVDFILFSDDDFSNRSTMGWKLRSIPHRSNHLSPRMRAKWPKLQPHVFLSEYAASIWIDASHAIVSPTFVDEMMACADPSGFALHKHPSRDCIYDELVASEAYAKYDGQPMRAQVDHYREQGHPEHWGLWACGSMARIHMAKVNEVMDSWWAECLNWSYQDQLSLPTVMRRHGWRPQEFPHHQVHDNPWFIIKEHPRNDV
jgi:Protein of unknown function (DUF616)